jgi:hypothetical protein
MLLGLARPGGGRKSWRGPSEVYAVRMRRVRSAERDHERRKLEDVVVPDGAAQRGSAIPPSEMPRSAGNHADVLQLPTPRLTGILKRIGGPRAQR